MINNVLSIVRGLAGLNVIAKLGPGRAAVLAVKSFVKSRSTVPTARDEITIKLSSKLKSFSQSTYVVLHGPSGVGKTTVVESLNLFESTLRCCSNQRLESWYRLGI